VGAGVGVDATRVVLGMLAEMEHPASAMERSSNTGATRKNLLTASIVLRLADTGLPHIYTGLVNYRRWSAMRPQS